MANAKKPSWSILPIIQAYKDCTECGLHSNARQKVFYRGVAPCKVLFIGEAPGKDEDLYGEPFIGKSGKLLDSLIDSSQKKLGYAYPFGITNTVCCLPLDEHGFIRPPSLEERTACFGRLKRTIIAANPSLLVFLGSVAASSHNIGVPIDHTLSLHHPAYILRNGGVDSFYYDLNLARLCDNLVLALSR